MVRQNYVLSHVKPQATLPKPHTLMIRPPFNNHEQILIHTCSYTPHALSPISTKSTNHSLNIPRKASKIWTGIRNCLAKGRVSFPFELA